MIVHHTSNICFVVRRHLFAELGVRCTGLCGTCSEQEAQGQMRRLVLTQRSSGAGTIKAVWEKREEPLTVAERFWPVHYTGRYLRRRASRREVWVTNRYVL